MNMTTTSSIFFFLEGDVTYHIGDKSYQLEYGDCLLIRLIPPLSPVPFLR